MPICLQSLILMDQIEVCCQKIVFYSNTNFTENKNFFFKLFLPNGKKYIHIVMHMTLFKL